LAPFRDVLRCFGDRRQSRLSVIAAILGWSDGLSFQSEALDLKSALSHWKGPSSNVVSCPGATLGISLFAAGMSRSRNRQPLVDAAGKIAVVADCRLDNRDALRSELSLDLDATDSVLLVEGYRRWGRQLPKHLLGDFACVLWDWGRRRCLAFRDPLGVKPLFYSRLSSGLVIASDTDLILKVAQPAPIPDDRAVVEHLLWEYASPERTFWSAISRLPGGHVLVAGPSETRPIERYWVPSIKARNFSSVSEVHEEFRDLFFRSVERRLESDGPVLAQLSGGLDSSLIVCVADRLRRLGRADVPSLGTVSQRFPGRSWDEGEFMRAVTEWTGLPGRDWDGSKAEFPDLVSAPLAGPGMGASRSSGSTGDLEIASQLDVHLLLSGEGGDQLGMPSGVTDDVIVRKPVAFAFEAWTRPDLSLESRLARSRRLVRQWSPLSVRQALATVQYRRRLPEWLHPRWRRLAGDIVSTFYPSQFAKSFEHNVQRAHWQDLTSGRLGTALDLQQRTGGRYGVEFRFPFLDQQLVEFVLSLPPQYWPREAPGARLHREVMHDLLPPKVRDRRTKAIFSGAIGQLLKRASAQLDALFYDGDWFSESYVRRAEAQGLLRRAMADDSWQDHWREWQQVRAIATLEAWLRAVFGYPSRRGTPRD
jgi:asparagine synthase (glutamine-hydrolysing)